MPNVGELRLAPVKSCRSKEDVEEIHVDSDGLFGDREYMLVEGSEYVYQNYKKGKVVGPGRFLSQREDPCLTSIIPSINLDGLELSAEGQSTLLVPRAEDTAVNRIPVSVWDWHGEGVDQGEEASSWASEIVGRHVRLVAVSKEKPRYVENNPQLGKVGFSDGFPITVASTNSFELLNKQLETQGNEVIPTNRTRTTLVLDNLEFPASDLKGNIFPEDYIETITIISNGLALVLQRIKACGRCPIPDTDQVTGGREKVRPVLTALNKLGRHGYHTEQEKYGDGTEIFFSQNFVMELPEDMEPDSVISVKKGAEVSVSYSHTTNWVAK